MFIISRFKNQIVNVKQATLIRKSMYYPDEIGVTFGTELKFTMIDKYPSEAMADAAMEILCERIANSRSDFIMMPCDTEVQNRLIHNEESKRVNRKCKAQRHGGS